VLSQKKYGVSGSWEEMLREEKSCIALLNQKIFVSGRRD
jgi:hypothetical protein